MSIVSLFDDSETFFTLIQRHMLDGLLGDDALSDRAVLAWAALVNIDDIDPASFRLIPALYARTRSNPALHQLHGRMKGIYRYYFYRNNRFLSRIEQVFLALMAAGIDFVVFKGVSILLQYHGSAAGRCSADCDILVHPRDMERSEALLADYGFAYCYDARRKLIDRHSHDFADAAGNGVDLHWHALLESCEKGIDDGFWSRSRYISWRGLQLRVLAPEDELLVAAINGIREVENARGDWLYDAWLILKAMPEFDWRLLHEELKGRRLQQAFLTASGMLRRFVPHFPEANLEKEFLGAIGQAARQVVAENRCFGLDARMDCELTAALTPSSGFWRRGGKILGTDWRGRVARSGNVVRHIRYDMHADGSVCKVYLHRDLLAFLGEVFDVADPVALRRTGNLSRRRDEVEFDLPPGLLHVPRDARSRKYAARVKTKTALLRFSSADISQVLLIDVSVTNDSGWPWHVFPRSDNTFGLSYHLFAADGTLLCWDMPRLNLLTMRPRQVAMLLPGDRLMLKLGILRPPAAGRYRAKLDIVHENVTWFDSGAQRFPSLLIEVS